MVQILQQGPSEATLRQQALQEAMGNIVSGASGLEKARTLRQQALDAKQLAAENKILAQEAIKRDQENKDITSMLALQKEGIADPRAGLEQLRGKYTPVETAPAVAEIPAQPAQYEDKMLSGPVRPREWLGSMPVMTKEATAAIPAQAAQFAPAPLQTYSAQKQAKMKQEAEKLDLEKRIGESKILSSAQGLEKTKQEIETAKDINPIKKKLMLADINLKIAQAGKAAKEANLGPEGKLERKIIETQAVDTAKTVSTLSKVKDAMDEALITLRDPNISQDQKIKTGQGLFKLLNSAEGSDAVGAEEAKRLGSFLEYNLFNITQPGAFIGRDVLGFTDQLANYSDLLGRRAIAGNKKLEELKKGVLIGSGDKSPSPKTVIQNGHSYTLNEQTGQYE